MLAGQHNISILVEHLHLLNHVAMIRLFRVVPFFGDGRFYRDRIANMDRADEPDPVITVGEGDGINNIGGQPDRNAENKRAVGDSPFKLLGFDPLLVHVVRKKITGLPGVKHDIRFGDRPPEGLSALP